MSLSNFQLINICKKLDIKLNGIYVKDELIAVQSNQGNYIINLQSASQGNGTHWLCCILDNQGCFYFDSFGEPAPVEVEAFIKKFNHTGKYGYNKFEIQYLTSDLCGYYCIGLLKYIHTHNLGLFKDANSFINLFQQNTKLNGSFLKKYLSSLIIKGN